MSIALSGTGADSTSTHRFILRDAASRPFNTVALVYESWDDSHFTDYLVTATRQGATKSYTGTAPDQADPSLSLAELWLWTGALATSLPVYQERFSDALSASDLTDFLEPLSDQVADLPSTEDLANVQEVILSSLDSVGGLTPEQAAQLATAAQIFGANYRTITVLTSDTGHAEIIGAMISIASLTFGVTVFTSASGIAMIALPSGIFVLTISAGGHTPQTLTLHLPADGNQQVTLLKKESITPEDPDNLGLIDGYLTVYTENLVLAPNAVFEFVLKSSRSDEADPSPGRSHSRKARTIASGSDGFFSLPFLPSAYYQGRRQLSAGAWGEWVDVYTPSSGPFPISEILGRLSS